MKSIWIAASAGALFCGAAIAQTPPPVQVDGAEHAAPPVLAAGTATVPTFTKLEAFVSVPAGQQLSSQVLGLHVHNAADKDMGEIKDIAYGPNGVQSYILGVGGFLDMGEHYVAVQPLAMKIAYDAVGKAWHATLDATADQLKAAPAFTYAH